MGEPLPIVAVAALLRLGTKYDIEVLRTEAVKRLVYEFPTSLQDYDGYYG